MATIPIAKLICISTGYAQAGVLYNMHKEFFGKDDDEILVWQADTRAMNPTVSEKLILNNFTASAQVSRPVT